LTCSTGEPIKQKLRSHRRRAQTGRSCPSKCFQNDLPAALISAAFRQGRRITTTLIHVCLPPDAYLSTTATPFAGQGNVTDFWIPGLPEPLTVIHESPLLEPVNERPSIKNSFCAGYPVGDTRWKRADGLLARQIRADRTSIGYKWTSAPVAANLDGLLDTWSCR